MAEPLVILGGSGNARTVYAMAHAMNAACPDDPPWDVLGFVDDGDPDVEAIERLGLRLLCTHDELDSLKGVHYTAGVGIPELRRSLSELADAAGLVPATLIHPTVVLDPDVEIGVGCVLSRMVAVSTNCRIGDHTMLGMLTSLGHDTRVGKYVFTGQSVVLAGYVTVGDETLVGGAAAVKQEVTIGDRAVVGMGSVVLKDVPDDAVVAGVPARRIR